MSRFTATVDFNKGLTMNLILFSILMLFSPLALAGSSLPQLNIRQILWEIIILVVIGVVLGIVHFWVRSAPFISEPIKSFILWALLGVGCLIVIYLLLGWIGM